TSKQDNVYDIQEKQAEKGRKSEVENQPEILPMSDSTDLSQVIIDRIVAQAKQSMEKESEEIEEKSEPQMRTDLNQPTITDTENTPLDDVQKSIATSNVESQNNYDFLFEQIEAKVEHSHSFGLKPEVTAEQSNTTIIVDNQEKNDLRNDSSSNMDFFDQLGVGNEKKVDNSPAVEPFTFFNETSVNKNNFLDEYMPNESSNSFFSKDDHEGSDLPQSITKQQVNNEIAAEEEMVQNEPTELTPQINATPVNEFSSTDSNQVKEAFKNTVEETVPDKPVENTLESTNFFFDSPQINKADQNQNDTSEVNRQSLIDLWIAQAKSKEQHDEVSQVVSKYNPQEKAKLDEINKEETGFSNTQDSGSAAFDYFQSNTGSEETEENQSLLKTESQKLVFEDLFGLDTPNQQPTDVLKTKESTRDKTELDAKSSNQYEDWFTIDAPQGSLEKATDDKSEAQIESPMESLNTMPSIDDIALGQDFIPSLFEQLEACGPDFMETLRSWQGSNDTEQRWETLPSIVPLRILWVFPSIQEAKKYYGRSLTQNSIRTVLFENNVILEQKDGMNSQFYKERWLERYRKARIDSEGEVTRLKVLRTNIEQIKKSFQEYADYQEELLRIGVNGSGNSEKTLDETPQLAHQRKELLYLLAKMQKIEEQLKKSLQASRDITSVIKDNYIQLQENYLGLIEQVAESERLILQSSAQRSVASSTDDLATERNRNHLKEQVKAIERFITDSYGSYFSNDPIWEYFISKDSFGLTQTLSFREHALETQLTFLSNWQSIMEERAALLEPQIWMGVCNNVELFQTNNYYPHLIINELEENDNNIGAMTSKAWLIIQKAVQNIRKVVPGGITPPNDPMMLLEILAGQDENPMAKIIWEKQEINAGTGGQP
ncbi:MAG TPA: hypothetical protein VHO90_12415, partial [Bacteroidales bacterium]|nr:hypothetical protein [Bacteroidales bacterium]